MPEPHRTRHDHYVRHHVETGEKRIIGIGRELEGLCKDGSTFWMHLSVSAFTVAGKRYFAGTIIDLDERKRREALMAAVFDHIPDGLMITDLDRRIIQCNAAFCRIFGYQSSEIQGQSTRILFADEATFDRIEALQEMRLKDERDLALLKRAQDAADMGARLTARLLTFARRRKLEPVVVNLNDLILGMAELLRRTLGVPIQMSSIFASGLWSINVTIYSEIGRGTMVNIYLPRVEAGPPASEHVQSEPEVLLAHRETILVVEDNPDVRDVTVARLQDMGFSTIAAESGPAAVAVLEAGTPVDLVFSDVVMAGGLSGYEVARWIRENRPGLKVLLTSGFVTEIAKRDDTSGENLKCCASPTIAPSWPRHFAMSSIRELSCQHFVTEVENT